MDRQEEKILIKRAKAGDGPAFEALVRTHERLVYSLAFQRLKHESDAQDAAQEVFVKAWQSLDSFRGDSRFSVWLGRITANVCTDMLRKKRVFTQSLSAENDEGEEIELEIADERFSPETSLEKKELYRSLSRALDSLSQDFREILILRELGGQSYEEIGKTLGLEPGTVKSRLFRARKKVCVYLAQEGNFPGKNPSKLSKGGAKK